MAEPRASTASRAPVAPPDRPPATGSARAATAAWYLQQSIGRAHALALSLLDAVVPALIGEDGLRELLELEYERSAPYAGDRYNAAGLFDWETAVVDAVVPARGRVAIVAAGAGREAIGLLRRGAAVDAWECSARLRQAGNAFLARHQTDTRILGVAPDAFPALPPGRRYDLCIVGWGAYGHIFPAPRRIAFLRACRERTAAPVLISWVPHVSLGPRHERLKRAVRGGLARLPLVGHRVDDDLVLGGGLVYEAMTPDKVGREAALAGFSADVRPEGRADAPHALLAPR
jgi:hypothetical protein